MTGREVTGKYNVRKWQKAGPLCIGCPLHHCFLHPLSCGTVFQCCHWYVCRCGSVSTVKLHAYYGGLLGGKDWFFFFVLLTDDVREEICPLAGWECKTGVPVHLPSKTDAFFFPNNTMLAHDARLQQQGGDRAPKVNAPRDRRNGLTSSYPTACAGGIANTLYKRSSLWLLIAVREIKMAVFTK